jgi:hypothetical protein
MVESLQYSRSPHQFLALGLLLVGVGLAMTGVSVYLESTATTCDGCVRFHPLFVLPVGTGALLTTAGGWLLGRT